MTLLFAVGAVALTSPAHASPRVVVTAAQAPTFAIAGGKGTAQLFVNATTGAHEAALTVLRLEAGAAVPPHVHDGSAELLYIERGEVEMTIGGQTHRAGPGDAVYIPPRVEHSARVTGGPLVAVQVYAAPGPEQRFTAGPRVPR